MLSRDSVTAVFRERLLVPGLLAVAAPGLVIAGDEWKTRAAQLTTGQALRIEQVAWSDPARQPVDLELVRYEVVAPDAELHIDGRSAGPLRGTAGNIYLRGHIEDRRDSRVTVVVDHSGHARGLARLDGKMLRMVETGAAEAPELVPLAPETRPGGFRCANGDLTGTPPADHGVHVAGTRVGGIPPEGYQARIALETDFEYFLQFGDTQDATDYAMDLVAFSSTIYSAEVETALSVSHLSLWTVPGDPWTQSGAGCLMYQFGRYWNDNNDAIDRTTAHLLSGRSGRSGIAWVGVLCNGEFPVNIGGRGCSLTPDTDNYGGAYGVTKGLDGNFDIGNPQSVWDIVAFAHEVGHNFDSPHTHCYNGIGGNVNPIDECYNGQVVDGCYGGTEQLPGPPGQGSGTLMSYCHLLSPGLSNISLTLGEGHGFGVQPERAPDRMLSHVMNRASAFPQCLAVPQDETVFDDGFESPDL